MQRDKAFQKHPYLCIGLFHFLNSVLLALPWYQDVLAKLVHAQADTEPFGDSVRDGYTVPVFDVGCGFGQEFRFLATDGVDPADVYGIDKIADL